ncbi:putative membrane protein [Methanomicrobium sp. W14]|uniref:small multi-drug export protein n=1 Tax=Methanomicrobium sp. W14 TaxID=2817839 RepID=UPI001AE1B9E6|nr:small multi-drug export protein [Methanomicrobium sp. W14]MBP2133518.1 putative membrane protein [Methanomicrobium sp. W14]
MDTAPGNGSVNLARAGKALFNLVIPFIVLGIYIFILYVSLPEAVYISLLGLMFIYFIPPAGKESVIPIGISLGMPWWIIGTSVAMMDIISTLFMILNFDLALKIPVLGDRWMKSFMEHGGEFFSKHRWIERFSSFGLAVFVMIPMQGTGGVATPIVGKMIGIPGKNVFLAVVAGSLSGCYIIALGSEYIKDLFLIDIRYGIAAVAVTAVVILTVYYAWTRKKKRLRERAL